MPFRHAHWWILALVPIIPLAFYRGYFSVLGTAPIEFHLHGISSTLWLALLAWQSWTLHGGRRELHRTTGLFSFAFFPFFLAGGVLVLIPEARHYVAQDGPFYSLYPPPLSALDLASVVAIAAFYYLALKHRRNPALHGGYLLATAIMLLPPILGRLMQPMMGLDTIERLDESFVAGTLVSALFSFAVAHKVGAKGGKGFHWAGVALVAGTVLYEVPGKSAWYKAAYPLVAELPWVPTSIVVALVGAAIGWAGWQAGKKQVRD